MEINGETPTEVKYIHKLLIQFHQKGRLRRTLGKLRRKPGGQKQYTKSDLADFLNHTNDSYAYDLLDKLEEEEALVHAGKKEDGTDLWKIDKKQLLKVFTETDYFQENKELFGKALDYTGEAFKFD
ncbi:hypothetical protein ACM16X_02745 [Haloarcula japonica]|uniref:hypothetical protein n=1 Tax=Haloarcula japonica TaxID=29282 RepID=UPI0039F6ADE5